MVNLILFLSLRTNKASIELIKYWFFVWPRNDMWNQNDTTLTWVDDMRAMKSNTSHTYPRYLGCNRSKQVGYEDPKPLKNQFVSTGRLGGVGVDTTQKSDGMRQG